MTFTLWTYNIETILGEKVETVLSRNVFSTRPRDFYDIYALVHTQAYDRKLFEAALRATARHRESINSIKNIEEILNVMEHDLDLKRLWQNYRRQFSYASSIDYEQIMITLRELLEDICLV